MDRAAFLGNLLRDFVSHLTLRVQDKDIIFCAQGDLHQFLFCTHALAAARGAQQAQHAALGFEPDLEEEASQVFFYVHQKAHRRTPVPLRFSIRLTTSSTAAEMARLTITQVKAPASSLVRQSW